MWLIHLRSPETAPQKQRTIFEAFGFLRTSPTPTGGLWCNPRPNPLETQPYSYHTGIMASELWRFLWADVAQILLLSYVNVDIPVPHVGRVPISYVEPILNLEIAEAGNPCLVLQTETLDKRLKACTALTHIHRP